MGERRAGPVGSVRGGRSASAAFVRDVNKEAARQRKNPKHQTPILKQIPNTKFKKAGRLGHLILAIEIWDLLGAWNLVFGTLPRCFMLVCFQTSGVLRNWLI